MDLVWYQGEIRKKRSESSKVQQHTVLRRQELRLVLRLLRLVRPVRDVLVVRDVPDAPVVGRSLGSLGDAMQG